MAKFLTKNFSFSRMLAAAGLVVLAAGVVMAQGPANPAGAASTPASATTAEVEETAAPEAASAPAPEPASGATSRPTTGATSQIDRSPLPTAKNLREGLKLDYAEQTILDATRDHTRNIVDNGLFVLLRRAAGLPELNERQFDAALSQINYDSLMDHPDKYRAMPLKLNLRVYRVEKWTSGKQFRSSPRWPKDRPIWWIGGIDFTGKQPAKRDVVVLSIVDPTPLLRAADPAGPNQAEGVYKYSVGRVLEVAGLFYKVYDAMSEGSENYPPRMMSYPVVVAWQVGGAAEASGGGTQWMLVAAAISLALLIGLFFYLRKNVKKVRNESGNVGFRNYRPLREVEAGEDTAAPEPPAEGDIDPALRDAAQRFKKEKNNG